MFSPVLDDDFGLPEGESSGEEANGISSCLVQIHVGPEALLSLSRAVMPDLPSSKPRGLTRDDDLD